MAAIWVFRLEDFYLASLVLSSETESGNLKCPKIVDFERVETLKVCFRHDMCSNS